MRSAAPANRADVPTVKPVYADGVKFPQRVKLPLPVARFARSGRAMIIAGPEQQVPTVIVEWMQEDARYCHLLADEQPASDGVQAEGIETKTEDSTKTAPDDLTAIKGIGPSAVMKLAQKGIVTYEDLSLGDPDRISDWLGRPTSRAKAQYMIEQAAELATKE